MTLDRERARGGRAAARRRARPRRCSRRRRASSRSPTRTWPARSAREPSRRATTRASSRSSPSAARGPLHAAEVADVARDPRGARAALPGHHLRHRAADERSEVRPDAHGLHGRGRDRRRPAEPRAAASSPRSCALASARDGVRRGRSRSRPALDCRYVGPGLRAARPAPGGPLRRSAALDEFHRLHEQEYGHAFRDPIEIVNAAGDRDRRRGRRSSACPSPPARSRTRALGEGESVFRRDGALASLPTRLLRARAASGRRARSTARRSSSSATRPCSSRPAGPRAPTPSGILVLEAPDEHDRDPHRSGHRRRSSPARSTRSRSRWATSSPACRTRRSSASRRTSAA